MTACTCGEPWKGHLESHAATCPLFGEAPNIVTCPECEDGRVVATFVYSNGDSTDVPAECPHCGGAGTVPASASTNPVAANPSHKSGETA